MADLASTFLGIQSPNPFWLASAPPTDKAYNVNRAFEAGWGGVVWKTLGEDPHIVNVNGPRYAVLHGNDRQVGAGACEQRTPAAPITGQAVDRGRQPGKGAWNASFEPTVEGMLFRHTGWHSVVFLWSHRFSARWACILPLRQINLRV